MQDAITAAPPVVVVERLSKLYEQRPVLRNVSFSVPAGQTVVIFGPNGAGKTTLLRVLATLAKPSTGSAAIAGYDLAAEADTVRSIIGYVGHQPHLYEELTARENLLFFARMFGLRDGAARADMLLARVGLKAKADGRVGSLSRGQVQRLALARGVLHDPAVLLLDEPDTGLDAEALALLGDLVRERRAAGGSVLLTTHHIERGLELADAALVLVRGRLVHSGPSRDLTTEQVREFYVEGGR
jgi:heme ABC exporter ATP-binding subunit CcmA